MGTRLVLPLLSNGGHPLSQQHRNAADSLLQHFGQFTTTRVMCVTRGPDGKDTAEHAALYEPYAADNSETTATLNRISENFKAEVASVNAFEEAAQAENYAEAEASGERLARVDETIQATAINNGVPAAPEGA